MGRADLYYRRRTHFGDVFVFLRRVAADANGSQDFSVHDDGDSPLQRRRTGQGECRHPAVADLVLFYSR